MFHLKWNLLIKVCTTLLTLNLFKCTFWDTALVFFSSSLFTSKSRLCVTIIIVVVFKSDLYSLWTRCKTPSSPQTLFSFYSSYAMQINSPQQHRRALSFSVFCNVCVYSLGMKQASLDLESWIINKTL